MPGSHNQSPSAKSLYNSNHFLQPSTHLQRVMEDLLCFPVLWLTENYGSSTDEDFIHWDKEPRYWTILRDFESYPQMSLHFSTNHQEISSNHKRQSPLGLFSIPSAATLNRDSITCHKCITPRSRVSVYGASFNEKKGSHWSMLWKTISSVFIKELFAVEYAISIQNRYLVPKTNGDIWRFGFPIVVL